jgi:hypothetical protein
VSPTSKQIINNKRLCLIAVIFIHTSTPSKRVLEMSNQFYTCRPQSTYGLSLLMVYLGEIE